MRSDSRARPPKARGERPDRRRGAERETLRVLVDESPLMISCYDAKGRLVFANAQWERTLGWTTAEAKKVDVLAALYPDPVERERVVSLIRTGDPGWQEFETRARDGRTVHTAWTRSVLSDGRRLCMGRDVTERRLAERALRQSEERFRAVFDAALEAIVLVDDAGRYAEVNPAACRLLGRRREEIIGLPVAATTAPGLDFPRAWKRFLADGTFEGDWRLTRPDGSVRSIEFKARARILPDRHLAIARDVTDRRRLEATVLAHEAYLKEGQRLSHTGSWAWEIPSGRLFWSDETYRIAGLDPAGAPLSFDLFLTLVHPDDRERVQTELARRTEACEDLEIRFRIRRPDGSVRRLHSLAHPTLDAAGTAVAQYVGVVMDVTERDRVEEKLKRSLRELQTLSQQVLIVREEEQARIARQVHDDIGQALTALRMDVAWLERRLDGPRPVSDKLAAMSALADRTLDAVQRIATELRPAALDELGLEAAAEWYVEEFQKRTGLSCRFDSELHGPAPDRDASTAAFRILQEALTNVARHSAASRAEVRLRGGRRRLVLEVRDDGRGIEAGRASDLRSVGIAGMRERARAVGGDLRLESGRGGGTTVRLAIPL